MLRDDIELLLGQIVTGPLTPAIYLLLKDTGDMQKLCADLHIDGGNEFDYTHGAAPQPSTLASGGFSLSDWLTNNAQPVTLQWDAESTLTASSKHRPQPGYQNAKRSTRL